MRAVNGIRFISPGKILLTKVYSIHVTVNTDKQIIPFQMIMLCSILVISWSRSWKLPQYHHHKYSLDLDSHVLSFIDADLSLLNQMIIFSYIRQSNSQFTSDNIHPVNITILTIRCSWVNELSNLWKVRKQLLMDYISVSSLIWVVTHDTC